MKLIDLFAKAITGRSARSLPKPSERKPQHGHTSRTTRRTLGKGWVHGPVPHRLHGDPATTGRQETASERKHRRRRTARCRATGHAVESPRRACACGAVRR